MAVHHLGGDALSNFGDAELARLLGDGVVHENLQQDIAQFLADVIGRSRLDGFQQLVGLLQQVRPQAEVGLLAIPGAALRRSERLNDLQHLAQPLHVLFPGGLQLGMLEWLGLGHVGDATGRRRPIDRYAAAGASARSVRTRISSSCQPAPAPRQSRASRSPRAWTWRWRWATAPRSRWSAGATRSSSRPSST